MNGDEHERVAAQFGVAAEQVECDHFVSHVLAFLSRRFVDQLHFIGGTALARTYLPYRRLSEDIDLIAIDDREALAEQLDRDLPRAFAADSGSNRR